MDHSSCQNLYCQAEQSRLFLTAGKTPVAADLTRLMATFQRHCFSQGVHLQPLWNHHCSSSQIVCCNQSPTNAPHTLQSITSIVRLY